MHDYEIVLKKGFSGIKKDMEEKLEALDIDSAYDMMEKKPFIDAVIMTCDAIALWSDRYADEAERQAKEETDEKRKAELNELSRICRKVPRYPAQSFYEAVQSQWLTQMFSRIKV